MPGGQAHHRKLDRSQVGVAIVTGAASGMGRATAHLFADEGAKVAVVDLGDDRVQAVVDEITRRGRHRAGLGARCVGRHAGRPRGRRDPRRRSDRSTSSSTTPASPSARRRQQPAAEYLERVGPHVRRRPDRARVADPGLPRRPAAQRRRSRSSTSRRPRARRHRRQLRPTSRRSTASSASRKALAVELGRTGVTVNCICPGPIRRA